MTVQNSDFGSDVYEPKYEGDKKNIKEQLFNQSETIDTSRCNFFQEMKTIAYTYLAIIVHLAFVILLMFIAMVSYTFNDFCNLKPVTIASGISIIVIGFFSIELKEYHVLSIIFPILFTLSISFFLIMINSYSENYAIIIVISSDRLFKWN